MSNEFLSTSLSVGTVYGLTDLYGFPVVKETCRAHTLANEHEHTIYTNPVHTVFPCVT